ncbi:unnamed protein product [Cuscuta campestris]|uniref:BED-type domain-containing protein n=1 Tax=Cuscuta campestris TaxID=132261 RepID=A0A484L8X6_9ASTE|nr:unnamed protein product [Cuscuta campestris]
MGSNSDLVPATPRTRDPAWEHCRVYKNGDKVQIQCTYCGKIFNGGGIYRVKEHLAGRRGNGSTCSRVEPDVQMAMQECLNASLMKGKKRKHAEETKGIDVHNSGEIGISADLFELSLPRSQKRDPAWEHCEMYKDGDKVRLKCLYCGKIFKGGGIHRVKEHLAGQKGNGSTCLSVQPDVRLSMLEQLNESLVKCKKQSSVDTFHNASWLDVEIELLPFPDPQEQNGCLLGSQEERTNGKLPVTVMVPLVGNRLGSSEGINNEVHMAIARFLLDAGVPFDSVNSPFFQPMIDAIASQGSGVVGPTYSELRNRVLKDSVQELRDEIDRCATSWEKTGCSLLVDEWTTENGKQFINFSVYCTEMTIFLRTVDASHITKSDDALFELLKEVVEQVGVRNLLQVITSSEERYVVVGKRLTKAYPIIFWTPCAAKCIDFMLEDIKRLEWVNAVLEKAKALSTFIYNHSIILNMTRRYTLGVDLVDLGLTPSSTDFLTLKRMVNLKHNLQSMVISEEWMESPKPKGGEVLDFITSDSFWSNCTLINRLAGPLLRLLRVIGGAKKPTMGYVYAGLYRAKETIKKEFFEDYLVYWNIIDKRWKQLKHHPLHAAGFYLNPELFYRTDEVVRNHIRSSMYDCVERLVTDPKAQDKLVTETTAYQNASGDFGRDMAVRARGTLFPGEWWSAFGGGCPSLVHFATRILNQPCTLISGKPNRVYFEWINRRMNGIEHARLNDLVFLRSNLRMRGQVKRGENHQWDPIAYENIALAEDWVSGKGLYSDDLGRLDWTAVDPPTGNGLLSGPAIDDEDPSVSGFNDCEIWDF